MFRKTHAYAHYSTKTAGPSLINLEVRARVRVCVCDGRIMVHMNEENPITRFC